MRTSDYLPLAQQGLSQTTRPQKVLVLGAGIAGLVAAYELLRAGHDPLILEAKSHVGGRIETLRQPFEEGLYAEAGAMRIPAAHTLTMHYVNKFGLETAPFTMGNHEAFCYLCGQCCR